MTFRPGTNAIRVSWGIILLAVIGFAVPYLWWGAGAAVLLVLLCSAYDLREVTAEINNVKVTRTLPSAVGRGQNFRVGLEFTRPLGRAWQVVIQMQAPSQCQPRDVVESFKWADTQVHVLKRQMMIPIRGKHEFGSTWFRIEGPLKLVEKQKEFKQFDEVRVLPETYFSGEKLLQSAASRLELLDKKTREKQHGVGTEFESLAEYREGADPRRIDWRTSARQRRLIVRRYQIERHRDVMVLVDCGRLMAASYQERTKLDAAIDAGLLLARVSLEGGDRCGFGLFDHEVIGYVPPQAGKTTLRGIQEKIYNTQSRWGESDFSQMFAALQTRQPKRSLMIIISDIIDSETTDRFRASLMRLGQRHVVLFAAIKTPLLDDVLRKVPGNINDSWETALAYRLLKEREQALHTLRKSGVHVLDVLPEQIGPKLINEFLALRNRNLL